MMAEVSWEHVGQTQPVLTGGAAEIHDRSFRESETLEALLCSAAAAGEPVTLVVNDPYRSTQTREALAALGRLLSERAAKAASESLKDIRFRVLVATGTHAIAADRRRSFEEEMLFSSGVRIDGVAWHDCHMSERLRELNGYFFHPMVADSRFLMPIGSVEPHYFAGVTGPHKTVTIGCMGHGDIERNHFHALHPESDVLRLAGNPVYDGIAEMVRALEVNGKRICAVAQVTTGTTVTHVTVGDCLASVTALLPAVRACFVRSIDEPSDVLHLRVSPPLSDNLYQADKALKNNHRAVRDGGAIILEAECGEGIGPEQFVRLLRESQDYASACRAVSQRGYRLGDHKAVKIRHLIDPAHRGVRVVIVSEHLPAHELEGTGLEAWPTVDAALRDIVSRSAAPVRRGVIIEDAGNMCVVAKGA